MAEPCSPCVPPSDPDRTVSQTPQYINSGEKLLKLVSEPVFSAPIYCTKIVIYKNGTSEEICELRQPSRVITPAQYEEVL